jgi:K+-transporting ATPase KdpF subunit
VQCRGLRTPSENGSRTPPEEIAHDGPCHLDSRPVPSGTGHDGSDVRLRPGLREGLKETAVIWLAVVVTLFLFVYLLAALLRPEWF